MKKLLTLVALCIYLGLPSILGYDYQIEPIPSNGYLGCFRNNVNGVQIMTESISGKDFTLDSCRAAITTYYSDIAVLGLQNGGECWFSKDFYKHKSQGESLLCNIPCKASYSMFCGGSNSMQVYVVQFDPTIAPNRETAPFLGYGPWSGYMGCFNDNINGVRGLSVYLGNGYTIGSCRKAVLDMDNNQYKYVSFAMQNGGECWTDVKENMGWYQQGKSTSCTMVCGEDPKSFCGGSYANQVYATRPGMNVGRPLTEIPRNAPFPTGGFIGCYKDDPNDRRLSHWVGWHYTIERCREAVTALGSNYDMFAMQDGNECWGSIQSNNYKNLGTAECSKLCELDSNAFCGAKNVNQIWRIDTNVSTGGFIGCYNDDPNDRRLSHWVGWHYTIERCREAVTALGANYNMFAMQDGNECWGGTPSDDYKKLGTAACSKLCEFDSSAYCGAKNVNQIWLLS